MLYYGCMPAHVISATSLQCVTQLLPCAHMITSSTPNSPTAYSNIAVSSPDSCLQSGDETNSNNVAHSYPGIPGYHVISV